MLAVPHLHAQRFDWVGLIEGKYNDFIKTTEARATGKLVLLGGYHGEVDIDQTSGMTLCAAGGSKLAASFELPCGE